MAEEISSVVDANEIIADVNKVTESIVKLEAEIDKCNDKSLKIEVEASAKKSLKDIIELQKELQKQVEHSNSALKHNAELMGELAQAATRMGQAGAAISQQGHAAEGASQHIQELVNRIGVLQGLLSRMSAGSAGFQDVSARVRDLQQQLASLQGSLAGAASGLNNTHTAAGHASEGILNLGRNAGGAIISMEKLAEALETGFTSFVESAVVDFISESIEGLGQIIMGTSEEVLAAKEAISEYQFEVKQMAHEVDVAIEKEMQLNRVLGETAANTKLSFDKRAESINQFRASYGHLLDMYSDEQIINSKAGDEIDKKIKKADELHAAELKAKGSAEAKQKEADKLDKDIAKQKEKNEKIPFYKVIDKIKGGQALTELETERRNLDRSVVVKDGKGNAKVQYGLPALNVQAEQATNNYQEHINGADNLGLVPKLEAEIHQLKQQIKNRQYAKFGITDKSTAAEFEAKRKDIEADPEMKALRADLEQKEGLVKSLNGDKFPKATRVHKEKPTKNKEMVEAIQMENARYEGDMLQAKEKYNGKDNESDAEAALVHKNELAKDEEEAAKRHYDNLKKLLDDYHGKVGESDAKFQERQQEAANDLQEIKNATTEEEKRNAQEIKKIHDDRDRAEQEELEKFRKRAEDLKAIADELEVTRKKSAVDKSYATGITAILEGMGIKMGDTRADKKRNIDIDKATQDKQKASNDIDEEKCKPSPDPKKIAEFQKTHDDAEGKLASLEAEKEASNNEKIIAGKKRVGELSVEFARSAFDAINTIRNNSFAKEQQQLQIQQQKLQTSTQQKIQAIQATTNFQVAKDNQIAKLTAQSAAQQNALQQKQNELALKKAKADKQAAEAGIILKTAVAIAGVLPMLSDPVTLPFGIAQIALITATGAVQYAAAASAPLPQFEKGGTTSTLRFIAGEKGPELGVTPSGTAMLFEKPGIYTAPIGTHIKNAQDTERLIRYAVNGIGYNGMSIAALTQPGPTISTRKIEDKLDELTDVTIQAAMLGRTIKNNVTVSIKNELQRPRA